MFHNCSFFNLPEGVLGGTDGPVMVLLGGADGPVAVLLGGTDGPVTVLGDTPLSKK